MCLINRSDVVRYLNRVLHHGLGLFQIFQRQIELSGLAINLRHLQISLRIFRIGIGDNLVLLERSVGLTIIHQVLGQAPDGVEVVTIEFNCPLVSIDGILVLLLLLVGITKRGIQLGRTRRVGDGSQHLGSAVGVSFLVVEIRKRGDRFLGIRLHLDRDLELVLRFLQVVVEAVKPA